MSKNSTKPDNPRDGSETPPLLLIPLQSFRLRHGPQDDAEEDKNGFVGRDELIQKLVKILENTRDNRGSYLIAGYRGVGKTSVINRVLSYYKKNNYLSSYEHLHDKKSIEKILNKRKEFSGIGNNINHIRQKIDGLLLNIVQTIRNGPGKIYENKEFYIIAIPFLIIFSLLNVFQYTESIFSYTQHLLSLDALPNIFAASFLLVNYILYYRKHKVTEIKINLGHDEILRTRDVLFNIISLLKVNLEDENYTGYKPILLNFLIITMFVAFIIHYIPDFMKIIKIHSFLDWNNAIDNKNVVVALSQILYVWAIYLWFFHYPPRKLLLREISRLHDRVAYTMEESRELTAFEFILGHRKTKKPMEEPQIELELLNFLSLCRNEKVDLIFVFDELDKISIRGGNGSLDTKLPNHTGISANQPKSVMEQIRERKKRVDHLLGGLKNLITVGQARFFFVAGREMLDSYQAEKGSTNSLYESLFAHFFEVPSLLTDDSDSDLSRLASMVEVYVCRRLMREPDALFFWAQYTNALFEYDHGHPYKDENGANCEDLESFIPAYVEDKTISLDYAPYRLSTYYHYLIYNNVDVRDAQIVIHDLRNFINYLTIHSWGNCKRLTTLFDSFVKRSEAEEGYDNYLIGLPGLGDTSDVKYMLYFSLLEKQRITFGANIFVMFNHHMSSQLRHADKLLVTTMAALHYTIKFHRSGFSRHHLFRMTEIMSVYSSPELNSAVDTAIDLVLKPYIRRIRNGIYRYRFYSDAEQEIRHISRISDLESASFNFSLDSIENIKAHYRKSLYDANETYGNLKECADERGPCVIAELNIVMGDIYALEQGYDEAVIYYETAVNAHKEIKEDSHLECRLRYIEALLKLGDVQEHRKRFERAVVSYSQAMHVVNVCVVDKKEVQKNLMLGDSKWDILRQPFWAFHFLHLKRSPKAERRDDNFPNVPSNLYSIRDARGYYRLGQYAFFLHKHKKASYNFIVAIRETGVINYSSEYTAYLGGYALVNLAENLLVGFMQHLHKEYKSVLKDQISSKEEASFYLANRCLTFAKSAHSFDIESFKEAALNMISGSNFKPRLFDEINFCDYNLVNIIGLMLIAAQKFEENALYHHAAIAYLKVLSTWFMFAENFYAFIEEGNSKLQGSLVPGPDLGLSAWVNDITKFAGRNINAASGSLHFQYLDKWRKRDIPGWPGAEESSHSGNRQVMDPLISGNLKEELTKLQTLKRDDSWISKEKMDQLKKRGQQIDSNPTYWHQSQLGQKLEFIVYWGCSIDARENDDSPYLLDQRRMPAHTTRSRAFSHWLNGRNQSEIAQRFVKACNMENTAVVNSKDFFENFARWNLKLRLRKEENADTNEVCAYSLASKAMQNFFHALECSRILTDNEQSLTFTHPGLVFFDMWKLLSSLVAFEFNRNGQTSSMDRNRYNENIDRVCTELSELVKQEVPTSHLDLEFVFDRTIHHLRTLERMGDTTNHMRSKILMNKYYLHDDYDDPEFHLDWTMVHMLGAWALIKRTKVEEAMRKFCTAR